MAAADKLIKKDRKPSVDIKNVQSELTSELSELKVKYLHTDSFGELIDRHHEHSYCLVATDREMKIEVLRTGRER